MIVERSLTLGGGEMRRGCGATGVAQRGRSKGRRHRADGPRPGAEVHGTRPRHAHPGGFSEHVLIGTEKQELLFVRVLLTDEQLADIGAVELVARLPLRM